MHKNSEVYKILSERMKERGYEHYAQWCGIKQHYIQVYYHTVQNDKWSSGACCHSVHIKAFCCDCWNP